MERCLYIKDYRNIGISGPQRLVLNTDFGEGRCGNLVFVVAQNNVGKSNVLDAVEAIWEKKFTDNDITNITLEDGHDVPQVTLCLKDDNSTLISYEVSSKGTSCMLKGDDELSKFWLTEAEKIANSAIRGISSYYGSSYTSKLVEILKRITDTAASPADRRKVVKELKDTISWYVANKGSNDAYRRMYSTLVSEFPDIEKEFQRRTPQGLQEYSLEKYGINFIPRVTRYSGSEISDGNLRCSPDNMTPFIELVLKVVGCETSEVKRTYEQARKSTSFLTTLGRRVNNRLKKISDKFNKLYFFDEDTYSFELKFESERINFELFRNGTPLVLSQQSTGFKWFFALYFNILVGSQLNPGDILIMDEPASHIHTGGRQELRRFMKEFAVREGVILLVATHDPFLLDPDYYDELRLLTLKDNEVVINNDFASIDASDPDTLAPIKENLTVKGHILNDPDKNPVFVEGITDYNYLIAMSRRQEFDGKYDSLAFVPMHGVGDKNSPEYIEMQEKILKTIGRIARRYDPIILVDGDKPGMDLKKKNGDNKDITVLTLSDVCPDFKEIETLFTPEDREKIGIADKKGKYIKHSSTSANFKTYMADIPLSDATMANFEKLFEKLLEIVE